MKQGSENTFGYEWQICQFGAQGIIDGVDYSRRNRDCRDLSDGFGAEGAGRLALETQTIPRILEALRNCRLLAFRKEPCGRTANIADVPH